MTQIYFNGALHQVTESGSFFENAEGWKVSKEDCIVIDPTDPWKNFTATVELKDIPAEAKYVVQDADGDVKFCVDIPKVTYFAYWNTGAGGPICYNTSEENSNWRKAFTTVEAIRQFEESKKQIRHDPTAFKVGDRVRVVRKAKDGEGGWDNTWDKVMDRMVGRECAIDRNYDSKGFHMSEGFCFPSFVLELVEEQSYKVSELRKMTLEQLVTLLK